MLNTLYRLTKAQQSFYISLFKQLLAPYGFNKTKFPGYFPSSKKIQPYLLLEEISDSSLGTASKQSFNTQLMLDKKKLGSFTQSLENGQPEIKTKVDQITSRQAPESFLNNKLIPNESLTKKQKNSGVNLLAAILTSYDLEFCYHAGLYPESLGNSAYIFLMENTLFPPNPEQKEKFNALLEDLKEDRLISHKEGESFFPIRNTTEKQVMQVIIIKTINLTGIENLYNDREFFKELLNTIFSTYQLEGKYRIEDVKKYFSLKPSTENPPNVSDLQNFQTIMSLLTEIGLIAHETKVTLSSSYFFATKQEARTITKLDRIIIDSFQQTEERELYGKIYAKHDFNPLTWLYIDYCFKKIVNRENSLQTVCLDSVYQDPIAASSAIECPIVLSPTENKIYDLKTILKLMFSTGSDCKRIGRDPLTHKVFELSDIRPAPNGLKIAENNANAQNQELGEQTAPSFSGK